MKCPIYKQEVIEDYCDHLILIYDESFQEIVYVNDDFSLDEFSSKSLDGDFISRLKEIHPYLESSSAGAPGFSSVELYFFEE